MSITEIKNIVKLIPYNKGELMYTSYDCIPKSEQKIVNNLNQIEFILNSINQKSKQ